MRVKSLIMTLGLAAAAGLSQADVLYSNGPVVNAEGRSIRQASDAFFGFGAQAKSGNAVAEDFTVTGEGWLLDSIDFFSFQNNATAFTLQTVSWSLMAGDLNTGTRVASGTAGLANGGQVGYRVQHNALNNTVRPIYRVVADIDDVQLSAGSYWLSWSMTGSLSSGPWIPPTADGAVGNAMQSGAGGSFVQILDNGDGVSLPFVLNGSVVTAVPEPASMLLMLVGGLAVAGAARRGSRKT